MLVVIQLRRKLSPLRQNHHSYGHGCVKDIDLGTIVSIIQAGVGGISFLSSLVQAWELSYSVQFIYSHGISGSRDRQSVYFGGSRLYSPPWCRLWLSSACYL